MKTRRILRVAVWTAVVAAVCGVIGLRRVSRRVPTGTQAWLDSLNRRIREDLRKSGYVATDARGQTTLHPPVDDLFSTRYAIDVPAGYRAVRTTVRVLGRKPVKTFWLQRDGDPNFYDAAALAQSLTRGEGDEQERAIRLLNGVLRLSRIGRVWEDGTEANQPNYAIYRSRLCTQASEAFAKLAQAVGIPSRGIGTNWRWRGRVFAHGFCELFIRTPCGRKWAMFDPYFGVAFKDSRGCLLSFAEVVNSEARAHGQPTGGVVAQALASKFAFLNRCGISYSMRGISTFPPEAYRAMFGAQAPGKRAQRDSPPTRGEWPAPERVRRMCHNMAFSLAPGQAVEWNLAPLSRTDLREGRGHVHCVLPIRKMTISGAKPNEMEADVFADLTTYGNGVMTTLFPNGAGLEALVVARKNVEIDRETGWIRLGNASRPGLLVLQLHCPYVMVGGRLRAEMDLGRSADRIAFALSALREQPKAYRDWRPLCSASGAWAGQKEIDLTPVFQRVGPLYIRSESATYSFLLRVRLEGETPPSPVVRSLCVSVQFQGTRASFPSAGTGRNSFTVYSSRRLSGASVSQRRGGSRLTLTAKLWPLEIAHVFEARRVVGQGR